MLHVTVALSQFNSESIPLRFVDNTYFLPSVQCPTSMVKNTDYNTVDSAPLGKRKKIDEEFSNGSLNLKKQRTRVRCV